MGDGASSTNRKCRCCCEEKVVADVAVVNVADVVIVVASFLPLLEMNPNSFS